ncbi:MAG: hypothetical protein ACO4CT_13885 [Planctomycetota bacterium]|jgi:hypothetical protein
MPIDFRRLETSKNRLDIDWNYPVYAPDLGQEKVEDGRTTTGRVRAALPRERALLEIRSETRMPLLVVRECGFCKGTEEALLNRRLNNEKTLLLTKWFHCVKLPNHVLDADHPFRNLFEGEHPPHLFLCRHDGSEAVAMDGQQTQSELWDAMLSLIEADYEGDAAKAVKGLLRVLDGYDAIDARLVELQDRLEATLDEDGPRSAKAKKLQRQVDELIADREKLVTREAELLDLGLKPLGEKDAGQAPKKEAAARR